MQHRRRPIGDYCMRRVADANHLAAAATYPQTPRSTSASRPQTYAAAAWPSVASSAWRNAHQVCRASLQGTKIAALRAADASTRSLLPATEGRGTAHDSRRSIFCRVFPCVRCLGRGSLVWPDTTWPRRAQPVSSCLVLSRLVAAVLGVGALCFVVVVSRNPADADDVPLSKRKRAAALAFAAAAADRHRQQLHSAAPCERRRAVGHAAAGGRRAYVAQATRRRRHQGPLAHGAC